VKSDQTEAAVYDLRGKSASVFRAPSSMPDLRVSKPTAKSGLLGGTLQATHAGLRSGVPWALLAGDAKQCLAKLPDVSVDCAVTSPPYYWQRDYVKGQSGQEETVTAFVQNLQSVFREVRRVLKPRGLLFLNLGDTYYSGKGRPKGKDIKQGWRNVSREKYRAVDRPGMGIPKKSLIGIPWRVALALQEDGWIIRSAVRWHKPKGLAEPSALDRPWSASETVFILAKSRQYYFNRKGLAGEEDIWMIPARPTKKEWRTPRCH
jgi:SAM-dependent methyltransferase